MEQLTEMDYSMIQMESNTTPQHIAMVMFFDQSTAKGGKVRFKEILRAFKNRLHTAPVFRRKIGGLTRGFDTPYWLEDSGFNLEFHIRHIALPEPGDWRQLLILLSRLNARGLDLSRPLWEAYVIEGLGRVEGIPDNSFAVLMKVHHAAVDGTALVAMLNGMLSKTIDSPPPKVKDTWQGEPDPEARELWQSAVRNNLRRPVKLVKSLREIVPRMRDAKEGESEDEEKAGGLRTRFNGRVGAHRVMDALVIELEQIRKIRTSVEGTTLNDVIVSVVGGALRKYLLAKNELPDRSLITSVPISARESDTDLNKGNQVNLMRVKLATNIEDPVARLRAVNESARQAKDYASTAGVRNTLEISEGLWPQLIGAGLKLFGHISTSERLMLPQQTIVSNVPGPKDPLYLAGAKLGLLLLTGPLSDGMGLFHGVTSANGKVSITFYCCRDLMLDPQFYRQCLRDSWGELVNSTA